MKVKIILDNRYCNKSGNYPLKLSLSSRGKTALISLGIELAQNQWEQQSCKVIRHPNCYQLNNHITKLKLSVDTFLMGQDTHGQSVSQIKERVIEFLHPKEEQPPYLIPLFRKYVETKQGHTKRNYLSTINRIVDYAGTEICVDDITREWLIGFNSFMSADAPSQNARNVHLCHLRTFMNYALDEELTTNNPFRKYKIKYYETIKRSLSSEQLRDFFNYPTDDSTAEALDIFKLCFFLIGINMVDLCKLTEIVDGRIQYHRSKTKKLYSIKVEHEALEIINKHKGTAHLIDALDRVPTYEDYMQRIHRGLRRVGECYVVGTGIYKHKEYKPLYPKITTYFARHSWASIAVNELNAPFDLVSKALGHSATSGANVTSVYVNYDMRKVDRLNRAMIDWVLYGKKTDWL